jgi:hypothetical protein
VNPAVLGCFKPKVVSESYTGPLDLVPGADWVVAVSLQRALSSARLGTDILTLEKAGPTQQAFAANASTGLVSVAGIQTFLGGGNGKLVSILNQVSGGADIDENASDNNRWFETDGFSSVGSPDSVTGGAILSTTDIPFGANTATFFLVFKGVAGGGTSGVDLDRDGGDYVYARMQDMVGFSDMWVTDKEAGGFAGNAATDSVISVCAGVISYGANSGSINGVDAAWDNANDFGGSIGTLVEGKPTIRFPAKHTVNGDCVFIEGLLAAGTLTNPQISAVVSNIMTAYSIA